MADFPSAPVLGQEFVANGVGYKWDGEKWITAGVAGGTAYLPLAGGTMTGFTFLNADPTDPLHSTTKQYADLKVLRSGDTMTGLLSLSNDPTAPLHAVPKRYMDKVVGALVAGVDLIGVFDATAGTIRWNADQTHTGNSLPAPDPALKGHYLMCAVEGSNPPAGAIIEFYTAGDWVLCDGVADWLHIFIANRIEASQVPTNPAVAAQSDVQAALEIMAPTTGATMTGPLTLASDPTANLHAATKWYVDAADTTKVAKAGDTMTGFLTLSAAPGSPMHAATKGYADGKVAKAGDVMTGFLTLNADPLNPMEAATKSYVDATASGGPPGGYLPISGGVMTGPLVLAADPVALMDAAPKQYVDRAIPTCGAAPPVNPRPGVLWFDPAGAQLYVWFDDGNSQQWVVAVNQIAATTAILKLTQRVENLEKELRAMRGAPNA